MSATATQRSKRIAAGGLTSQHSEKRQGGPVPMNRDEEAQFFKNWAHRAQELGELGVVLFHLAYEEQVGERVPNATIYQLLERQGWKPARIRSQLPPRV